MFVRLAWRRGYRDWNVLQNRNLKRKIKTEQRNCYIASWQITVLKIFSTDFFFRVIILTQPTTVWLRRNNVDPVKLMVLLSIPVQLGKMKNGVCMLVRQVRDAVHVHIFFAYFFFFVFYYSLSSFLSVGLVGSFHETFFFHLIREKLEIERICWEQGEKIIDACLSLWLISSLSLPPFPFLYCLSQRLYLSISLSTTCSRIFADWFRWQTIHPKIKLYFRFSVKLNCLWHMSAYAVAATYTVIVAVAAEKVKVQITH